MTNPALYDPVLAYIEPDELEADMRLVAEETKEAFIESVKHFLREGFLVWSRAKPADFFETLRAVTAPEDQLLLLSPDLTKLIAQGLLPMPQGSFWQKLGELAPLARELTVNELAGEFRRLMRARVRREGGNQTRDLPIAIDGQQPMY